MPNKQGECSAQLAYARMQLEELGHGNNLPDELREAQ